jgi:hypothetical protein
MENLEWIGNYYGHGIRSILRFGGRDGFIGAAVHGRRVLAADFRGFNA